MGQCSVFSGREQLSFCCYHLPCLLPESCELELLFAFSAFIRESKQNADHSGLQSGVYTTVPAVQHSTQEHPCAVLF